MCECSQNILYAWFGIGNQPLVVHQSKTLLHIPLPPTTTRWKLLNKRKLSRHSWTLSLHKLSFPTVRFVRNALLGESSHMSYLEIGLQGFIIIGNFYYFSCWVSYNFSRFQGIPVSTSWTATLRVGIGSHGIMAMQLMMKPPLHGNISWIIMPYRLALMMVGFLPLQCLRHCLWLHHATTHFR